MNTAALFAQKAAVRPPTAIAAFHFPFFLAELVLPGAGGAVAVHDGEERICGLNQAAAGLGVRRGQRVSELRAFGARLLLAPRPEDALQRFNGLAGRLQDFSPGLWLFETDSIFLDLEPLSWLRSEGQALAAISRVLEGAGHVFRVALASRFNAARLAAVCNLSGRPLCISGREQEYFRRLPLRLLEELSAEAGTWLASLGVRLLGDLTKATESAWARRLPEVAGLHRLISGREGQLPLRRFDQDARQMLSVVFDPPVDSLQALLERIKPELERRCRSWGLAGRQCAVWELELLSKGGRTLLKRGFRLSRARGSAAVFLEALRLELERQRLPRAVAEAQLCFPELCPAQALVRPVFPGLDGELSDDLKKLAAELRLGCSGRIGIYRLGYAEDFLAERALRKYRPEDSLPQREDVTADGTLQMPFGLPELLRSKPLFLFDRPLEASGATRPRGEFLEELEQPWWRGGGEYVSYFRVERGGRVFRLRESGSKAAIDGVFAT